MNLLLTFSYNISLQDWANYGFLDREIQFYKKLSKAGIKVNLLTYGNKSDLKFSKFLENIKIFPIKNFKNDLKFRLFIKSFLYPILNYRILKDIDIIKTNQMNGSWIIWFLKIIFRKQLIIRCGFETYKNHLYKYKNKNKHIRVKLRLLFLYIIELISYKISDHIIMSNEFDKRFVLNFFPINPKKISVIPNFIDTDKFRPILKEKEKATILFIGRLSKEKNLENLIEAFKLLDNFSLDIIGRGEMKQLLDEKVKKENLESKISFLGTFNNSELPNIINNYNFFILTSFWEGNPKTLLEAMSCGLICIGTNTPGIREIIKHKKTGILCNHDSKSIASAIEFAYNNKALLDDISKSAREYVINNHSINKIIRKESEIYHSLLKKQKMQ